MPPLGERSSCQWYNNHTLHAISGTLFVVATPIGNLEDVTLRALRVLREVDVIAAEDTRRTAKLLAHHGIATPSLSFHQHNVRTRMPQLLSRLQSGAHVALVTDAGTPGISDPGMELVNACIHAQVPVDPVPGVSAPLAAAVASGFPLIPLTIFGFPPHRSKDRKAWFRELEATGHTATFFESPHRIAATLGEAGIILGERPIMVARELTKLHQEFTRGTAGSVSSRLRSVRGEITVVVGPANKRILAIAQSKDGAASSAVEYFGHLTAVAGLQRRAALSEAAKKFGLPTRVVYAAVEKAKQSG